MSRRAARTARPAALVAALALAGCGGSDGEPHDRAAFGSGPGQPPPLRTFTCADWNRADHETRRATVAGVRKFAGGDITGEGVRPGARGAVLKDDHAFNLFNHQCKQEHARHFLLYKIYTHAAAFAGRP